MPEQTESIFQTVVDRYYTMDPKTETIMFQSELQNGMVVLLADPTSRAANLSTLEGLQTSFFRYDRDVRNRWCTVSRLSDNKERFIGIYYDGIEYPITRVDKLTPWLVKRDSIPTREVCRDFENLAIEVLNADLLESDDTPSIRISHGSEKETLSPFASWAMYNLWGKYWKLKIDALEKDSDRILFDGFSRRLSDEEIDTMAQNFIIQNNLHKLSHSEAAPLFSIEVSKKGVPEITLSNSIATRLHPTDRKTLEIAIAVHLSGG